MANVDSIEQQVRELSSGELAEFRDWFAQYDAEAWDRQFEADATSGKLDAMAERALEAHAAGQAKKL